ncbi:hypothetical protein CO666_28925 [Rhizobium chutanense]|uniref:Uncharacterized protein n=1 Tax=Rhizobium chutanense TaxID=2035448 RepID=A0A2A6J340_9HYPH|nr:hypothetical protein CO666_28925 [Rhizobium chutanense]
MLVTGIQPRRVCAVSRGPSKEFAAPKDLGALDSCDEHRNEGGEVGTLKSTMGKPADHGNLQRACRHP